MNVKHTHNIHNSIIRWPSPEQPNFFIGKMLAISEECRLMMREVIYGPTKLLQDLNWGVLDHAISVYPD